MNNFKIVLLLLLVAPTMLMAQNYEKLLLWKNDGTKTSFVLSQKPVVSFSKNNMVIVAGQNRMEVPMNKILRYSFESTQLGLENVTNITAEQKNDCLQISGLATNAKVGLYATDGKSYATKVADGKCEINLKNLPFGTYVVKVGTSTFKFIKQ